MSQEILSMVMIEPIIRQALQEDLGDAGDITTNALVSESQTWTGSFVARQHGVIAGLDLARAAFHLMDPKIQFVVKREDGTRIAPQEVIATVKGSARHILMAERVALNFLCHMSGIATATHSLVEAVKPHQTRICCTRKTTPGLRQIEKYAVRMGGGFNHRFGLYDAVLIKDNHLAVVGNVRDAVMRAREAVGHLVKIELEVDTLDQLREVLDLNLDAVLLDNMDTTTLAKAVAMVGGRFRTEASGGVTVKTVAALAATGVDVISVGWVTHSAPILDIGLDQIALNP